MSDSDSYERIYAVVCEIPSGRVATYGQVARLAGLPRKPRVVGYALHALDPDSDVPWQRVINARGRISSRAWPGAEQVQRQRLVAEGVRFDSRGQISLACFGWKPAEGPSLGTHPAGR